VVHRKAARFKQ